MCVYIYIYIYKCICIYEGQLGERAVSTGPRDTLDVCVFKCALGLGVVLRARGCTPELVQRKVKSTGSSLRLPPTDARAGCAQVLQQVKIG